MYAKKMYKEKNEYLILNSRTFSDYDLPMYVYVCVSVYIIQDQRPLIYSIKDTFIKKMKILSVQN